MFRCGAFGCLERAVDVCLRGRGSRTPDAQSRLIQLGAQSMESLPTWLQHMGLGIRALLPFPIRTHPSMSFTEAVHCAVVSEEVTAWSDMICLGTCNGGIFTGHTVRH